MNNPSSFKKTAAALLIGLCFTYPSVALGTPVEDVPTEVATGASKVSDAVSAQVQTAEANWNMFGKVSLDRAAYALGQAALNQVTENTVSWIRGGFHGSPSFALDMQQLLNDVADMVAGNLAQQVRDLAVCDFNVNFKINLMNSLLLAPQEGSPKYARTAVCPFNSIDGKTPGEQLSAFGEHLAYGGWGFFENTMRDAGNEFGLALMTKKEYDKRVANHQSVQTQKLTESGGFLDLTDYSDPNSCHFPDEYLAREKNGLVSPGEQTAARNQYCTIKTPGSVIANQVHETFGIDMQRLGAQDSFNKIATAFMQQMGKTLITGLYKEVGTAVGQSNSGLFQPAGFNPNDDPCLNADSQQLTSFETIQKNNLVKSTLETGTEAKPYNEIKVRRDAAYGILNTPSQDDITSFGLTAGVQPFIRIQVDKKTAKNLLEYENALKTLARTQPIVSAPLNASLGSREKAIAEEIDAKVIIDFYEHGKDEEKGVDGTSIVFQSLLSQGFMVPETATSKTLVLNPGPRTALVDEMHRLNSYLESKKDDLATYYETSAALTQIVTQVSNNATQQVTAARRLGNLTTCTKQAFYNLYNKQIDTLSGRTETPAEGTVAAPAPVSTDPMNVEVTRTETLLDPRTFINSGTDTESSNTGTGSQQFKIAETKGLQEYTVTFDNIQNVNKVFADNNITFRKGDGVFTWSDGSLQIDKEVRSPDIGEVHIKSVSIQTFDDRVYDGLSVVTKKVATITIEKTNGGKTDTYRVAEKMIESATKQDFTILQKPGNIPMTLTLANSEAIRDALVQQNVRFNDATGEFLAPGGTQSIDFSGTNNVIVNHAYVNTYTTVSTSGKKVRNVYIEVYFKDNSMRGFIISSGKISQVIQQQMI